MIKWFFKFIELLDRISDVVILAIGGIGVAGFWLVGFLAGPEAALLASFPMVLLGFTLFDGFARLSIWNTRRHIKKLGNDTSL